MTKLEKLSLPKNCHLFVELIKKRNDILSKIKSMYYFKQMEKEGRNDRLLIVYQSDIDFKLFREEIFSIQNSVQDQLKFPDNMLSPPILQTLDAVYQFDPFNEFNLTPDEFEGLIDNRKLIFGEDLLEDSKLHEQNRSFQPKLHPQDVLKLQDKYPVKEPLLDPFICWERSEEHIPRGDVSQKIGRSLQKYKDTYRIQNWFIYGRWFGSGKTALLYWLIKVCKNLHLPFIYRSEFWKDTTGKYKEDDEGINDPDAVANWVKERLDTIQEEVNSQKCVIFLDEVDINLKHDDFEQCLIITAAKEIPDYVKEEQYNFVTLDLMVDHPFAPKEIVDIINSLIANDITHKMLPQDMITYIATNHHKWRFPTSIKSAAVAIRVASYALASTIKRALHENKEIHHIKVLKDDIKYWLAIADSPYLEHYPETHDVHAEFLIYDGESYISVDPFNPGPLP